MNTKRILIVNPDTGMCDQLERILSRDGYLTYSAVNCLEAEKLALILTPHLTILSEDLSGGVVFPLIENILRFSPDGLFFLLTKPGSSLTKVPQHLKSAIRLHSDTLEPDKILKSVMHLCEILDLRKENFNTEQSLRKRNKELEEVNERLRHIVESTRRLTSFSGTQDIGPVILHEFAGSMNATGGSLFLHKQSELILACSLDPSHVPQRIPLPLSDDSVINLVLSRNEPVLIEDIRKEHPKWVSGWFGYTDNSLLAFPLLEKQGDIVGIITLHNKKNPPFTKQDRELGSILASYGSETLRATQAIENLKQSEEKARIILESNPDPMVVFDNQKRVNYFNPAFTRVFGWTLDELVGKPMTCFVPEGILAETLAMKHMVEKGESYSGVETRRLSKSGATIPVSISGSVFRNDQGQIQGSVCNIRDITNQKNLEAQLVQSQKMEAIGTLASGIAHDFNNILSAIFGNLDLALLDLPTQHPAHHNIENIRKAAQRAKNLVGQILAFSRKGEKGKSGVSTIHPHLIIKEALFLLRASLPSTVEIKEHFLNKTGTVMADPTQFHQIIMNMCTNAHHAMKQNGGLLTIGLDIVDEPGENPDDPRNSFVKLTISDTGCGMDEETVKRIFDPYFTTKDKDLGTGLGLSVVRKIVDDCKGKISVFSRPGHGTRFELFFPNAGVKAHQEDLISSDFEKGSGNILFVDDEKDIATLGVTLLQRLGYTVVSSTQPVEALDLVKNAPEAFDIVITDMTMPKMTGLALAEALKKIRPELPIILCTGFNQSEISETSAEVTVDSILKKPVNLLDFSRAITSLLSRNQEKKSSGESELHLPPS